MSILEQHEFHTVKSEGVHKILESMPFEPKVKQYLAGRFEQAGQHDFKKHEMSGKELHGVLHDLRHNTHDGVNSYHVDKLTHALEQHFQESLGKGH